MTDVEVIEIVPTMLGLEPYVLLTTRLDDDGDVVIDLRAGGGIDDVDLVREVLESALAGLPTSEVTG